MKFKTSKAIKRLLCIMLVTGMVFTGFPKTLWHNAESGIVNVQAAEEGWKTDIKTALDKVTTYDLNKYPTGISLPLNLKEYNMSGNQINEVNTYLNELMDSADYNWLDILTVSSGYNAEIIQYVFYRVKADYIGSDNVINKTKAKTDYETFHKRLENGEAFNIVQERVQAAIDNTLNFEDYSSTIKYYWTGFYITDLKIPYSQMGDLIAYLNGCSMNDEYTFWCTFTPRYDTNKQYVTYIQLDANEAVLNDAKNKVDKSKLSTVYKDFQKRISSLTYAVDKNMSDVEKVLLVHDWIAREIDYDYDNYRSNSIPNTSYSAYGAITTGKAVCSGYARLANVLLNGLGVKTQSITSSDMNHEWNAVCINGHYYHMDITWDDWGKDDNYEGVVYHQYFLYNDTEFKDIGSKHYNWTGVVCDGTDSFSDMIFRDDSYKIVSYSYYNGYWYYVDNGEICRSTINGSKKETVVTKQEIVTSRALYMYVYGNHMYYTTHSDSPDSEISSKFSTRVWDMNLDDGTKQSYVNLSNNSDFQYGVQELSIKNGVLKIDGTSITITKTLPDIPEKTTSQILYGDVNDDGKIDSRDAVELKKYLANFGNYINKDTADVNCDGKIKSSDAVKLLRYLAKDKVTLGAA